MSIFQSKKESDVPATKEEFFAKVEQFVESEPNALYLIDGTKDVQRSVICRQNANGGKSCLNLDIDGVSLFRQMQDINFFCSLPNDISSTHFECRRII